MDDVLAYATLWSWISRQPSAWTRLVKAAGSTGLVLLVAGAFLIALAAPRDGLWSTGATGLPIGVILCVFAALMRRQLKRMQPDEPPDLPPR